MATAAIALEAVAMSNYACGRHAYYDYYLAQLF